MVAMMVDADELRDRLGRWSDGDAPLYEALADALERLVASGHLPAGERLPAQRTLADTLAVSRGTVMGAYDRLVERGLAEARQGSGTRIRPAVSPTTGPREAHLAVNLGQEHIFGGILHPGQHPIDLRGACWIGTDDLPDDAFALSDDTPFGSLRDTAGYFPSGIPSLRRALAEQLTGEGLPTEPQELLVTSGAQQAIDLVANLLVAPEDDVVLEELSYPGAIDALLARQARLHPVRLTAHGVDVDHLHRSARRVDPRLVYLVPTCHNPTGTILPDHEARRLVEGLADSGAVLIDDRTLAHTHRTGESPPPPLAAHATGEQAARILTVGSLSKPLWGGLRIGFVRARGHLLDHLARLKAVADLGTSVPSQVIAARLLAAADRLYPARRRALDERCERLTAALEEALPGWSWQPPRGGLCLWVRLPAGTSSRELVQVAARHGVGLAPGSASSPGREQVDHLRLPFGQPPEVLEEAVERLQRAWGELQGRSSALEGPGVVV